MAIDRFCNEFHETRPDIKSGPLGRLGNVIIYELYYFFNYAALF